jgi:hypothetical protein|tara:strand:+ start:288 stop:434 length:147 start_codon:yes stop_codon:yes gene_type:complete
VRAEYFVPILEILSNSGGGKIFGWWILFGIICDDELVAMCMSVVYVMI